MKVIKHPKRYQWKELVKRPVKDFDAIQKIVAPILDKVKRNGDRALKKFIWEYDNVRIDELLVSKDELSKAGEEVPKDLKKAIKVAIAKMTDRIIVMLTARNAMSSKRVLNHGFISSYLSLTIIRIKGVSSMKR